MTRKYRRYIREFRNVNCLQNIIELTIKSSHFTLDIEHLIRFESLKNGGMEEC